MTQAANRSVPRNAGEENLSKEGMASRIDQIVDALFSTSSGTTAPASPALGMQWLDTSSAPYRLKLWDGVQWSTLGAFNPTAGRFEPYTALSGGASRPAGAVAGTPWLKTNATPWTLYVFDGADDIPLMSINPSTNVATVPSGTITTAQIAAAALVTAAAGIAGNDNDTSWPTSAAVIDYVAANASGLGIGQTIQDVRASRAHSTAYQNTTGKPIFVSIIGSAQGTTIRNIQGSNDGTNWVSIAYLGVAVGANFVVPPSHYYRVDGSATISHWVEWR